MPRKNQEPDLPSLSPAVALRALTTQLDVLDTFKGREASEAADDENEWEQLTGSIIERAFGNGSSNASKFLTAQHSGSHAIRDVYDYYDDGQDQRNYDLRRCAYASLLRGIVAELKIVIEAGDDGFSSAKAAKSRLQNSGWERTVNIHNSGTLGALQLGDDNRAHVVQNVNTEIAALIEALGQLQKEVALAPVGAAIGTLCNEVSTEVHLAGVTDKARSLLVGIAQLVQTIGAMPAAYPILYAAAHAVGVDLPTLPCVH